MLTLQIVTEHKSGDPNEKETWQATKIVGEDAEKGHREPGWYVRGPSELTWSREPFADASASRETVAQLLRKEHSALY